MNAKSVILHTVPLDHLIPIVKYFVYIINIFVKYFVYISDRDYPNNLIYLSQPHSSKFGGDLMILDGFNTLYLTEL